MTFSTSPDHLLSAFPFLKKLAWNLLLSSQAPHPHCLLSLSALLNCRQNGLIPIAIAVSLPICFAITFTSVQSLFTVWLLHLVLSCNLSLKGNPLVNKFNGNRSQRLKAQDSGINRFWVNARLCLLTSYSDLIKFINVYTPFSCI